MLLKRLIKNRRRWLKKGQKPRAGSKSFDTGSSTTFCLDEKLGHDQYFEVRDGDQLFETPESDATSKTQSSMSENTNLYPLKWSNDVSVGSLHAVKALLFHCCVPSWNVVQLVDSLECFQTEPHYFWGCRSAWGIYLTFAAAVVFRQQWILLGILGIFVGKVVERILVWSSCVSNSREYHKFISLVGWLHKLAVTETERVVRGDILRRWLAGSAVQIWKKRGYSIFTFVLRFHMRELNHETVTNMRQVLDRAENLYSRSQVHLQF